MSAETRGMTLKEYCIRSRRAELLQQWHYAKNDGLTPDAVTCHSRQKVWWIDRLGHEWQQEIYSRTALCRGCPFCAGREVLAGFNDLASTHPALSAQWDREKNFDLTPQMVMAGNSRKVWWRCEKGHSWQASIASRASGCGCPVCANRKILPGFNDFATTHPSLAVEWHPTKNGDLTPQKISYGYDKRFGGSAPTVTNGRLRRKRASEWALAVQSAQTMWRRQAITTLPRGSPPSPPNGTQQKTETSRRHRSCPAAIKRSGGGARLVTNGEQRSWTGRGVPMAVRTAETRKCWQASTILQASNRKLPPDGIRRSMARSRPKWSQQEATARSGGFVRRGMSGERRSRTARMQRSAPAAPSAPEMSARSTDICLFHRRRNRNGGAHETEFL